MVLTGMALGWTRIVLGLRFGFIEPGTIVLNVLPETVSEYDLIPILGLPCRDRGIR